MRNSHCIFFRSDLRYDGRICSLIRTLANTYPDDKVYLYELIDSNYTFSDLPSNVEFRSPKLFSNLFKNNAIFKRLRIVEYAFYAFFFMLFHRLKTVQVHHEMVCLGPLLYKLIYRKTKLVYNDQELYHPKDRNIPSYLYWIEFFVIKYCDLVIITNEYRRKALLYIHKNRIDKYIIVDNYVFSPEIIMLDSSLTKGLQKLKSDKKKILLHQGGLSENRGMSSLVKIAEVIPNDWVLIFIGAKDYMFKDFKELCKKEYHSKILNFGYVDYSQLNSFYQHVDASVLFYDSSTFNNKYCAPNRLYSAVNNGLPIIVNSDNVTLTDFVAKYDNGVVFPGIENVNDFFNDYNNLKKNSSNLRSKFEYKEDIVDLKLFYNNLC